MKKLMNELNGLSYRQLINLNGGYSSSSGCSSSVSSNGSTSSGSYSSTSSGSYNYNQGRFSYGCRGGYSSVTGYLTGRKKASVCLPEENPGEYKLGENDCDIWVQNFLEGNGIHIKDAWGDAVKNSTKDHVTKLGSKCNSVPETGLNVVMMTDSDKYSLNHTALLQVNNDGSVVLYQNSKKNDYATNYKSYTAFQNDYAYKNFAYCNVDKI